MASAGQPNKLGPFSGGLHNAAGSGEYIDDSEVFELVNMEVDFDGSLTNRPEINKFTITGGPVDMSGMSFIGTYVPADGRQFVVVYFPSITTVYLVNAITGIVAQGGASGVIASSSVQYNDKLWVPYQTGSSISGGGSFSAPTPSTLAYAAVASMPQGDDCTQYKDRVWIACGLSAIVNTSRFYYCEAGDPTNWLGPSFIDVAPGNGQKLVALIRLGSDIVLFKEHSTHRFTYTSDPRRADLSEIDSVIGAPAIGCAIPYQNNTIYVLHDNAVYELFQYIYNRISNNISMVQVSDLDLYAKDQYGLTRHRDRLFVRYFTHLYVYSLKVKKWSSWQSDRKFSKVVTIPSTSVGLDRAYAHSASVSHGAEAYFFQDERNTSNTYSPNGTDEVFTAKVTTKTYDFDVPQNYKIMFWWGVSVATSGDVTGTYAIPNASTNLSWTAAQALYGSWAAAIAVHLPWSSSSLLSMDTLRTPTMGTYARKFLKMYKKTRFRQMYFTISFQVIGNGGVADASLRLYDMVIVTKQAQLVSRGTT